MMEFITASRSKSRGYSPMTMRSDVRRSGDLDLAQTTILLMEDEAIIALDIEGVLVDRKADVFWLSSLDEGLSLVREMTPDAAILDVDLGGVDVYPLAEELIEKGVPVLFHTGHGRRTDLLERFPSAVVCKKPTESKALVDAVSTMLANQH